MVRVFALLCMAGMLAACSSHPAPVDAAASSAAPAAATTNALDGTPLAPYGHDLNRAKNVQNIVNERAKKRAKALNDASH